MQLFDEAWHSGQHPGWSRGRIAFYIGLCYQQQGEREQARHWLRLASSDGLPEFDGELPEFLASIGCPTSRPAQESEIHFVAFAPDDHATSIQQAVERLRAAQAQMDDGKLDTKIRYATWLLLVGELTSSWDELFLSSNSVEALSRGKELLAQVAFAFDNDPQLQQQLDRDPALAIRFDSAMVRLNVLNQREAVAWERERARLNQLRSIARSYRTTIEALGNSELSLLLGDSETLQTNQSQVLQELANVEAGVMGRKDLYLFSDEPNLLEGSDFAVLRIEPRPFTDNLASFHKALLSLSFLKMAEQDVTRRSELLVEARKWATAAQKISEPLAGIPSGVDERNSIAAYVQSAASDGLGLLAATHSEVAKRAAAREEFTRSRGELSQLEQLLAESRIASLPTGSGLKRLAEGLANRLSSESAAQKTASLLLDSGEISEARQELFNGALRHQSEKLAVSYLQLSRQFGLALDQTKVEMNRLEQLGLLSPNSPMAALEISRITLAGMSRQFAKHGVPIPPSPESDQLKSALATQEVRLREVLKGSLSQPLRAQLEAELALTLSFSIGSSPKKDVNEGMLQEAVRLARDASMVLKASASEPGIASQERASYQDSLIASRMALGYAAVVGLPTYRDEALLAFSSAIDVASEQVGTATSISLLGSPLLKVLNSRDGNADARLAAEERARRQLMTRFVEAAYTLQFGEPAAAAKQLADASSQSRASGASGGSLQAEALLRDSDGFEAGIDLQDSLRAFQVLGQVKAGQPEEAVRLSLALVTSDSHADLSDVPAGLAKLGESGVPAGIGQLQSPLSAVAVALAAEAYACSIPLSQEDLALSRAIALQLGGQASERALKMLVAPRLAERYPHLKSLAEGVRGRLATPDPYLLTAKQRMSEGKIAEGVAACEEGLLRHPAAPSLWRELLRSKLEYVRRAAVPATEHHELLLLIDVAAKRGHVTAHDRAYIEGIIYEQVSQPATALSRYEAAVVAASNGTERVRALAKVSALRARQSVAAAR